jgi:hypothetical protein
LPSPIIVRVLVLVLLGVLSPFVTCAANDEFDNARWKLQLNAWISAPSGYFNGKSGNGYFDLNHDFGFGNYATFSGTLDWRFKRKHHLLFSSAPVFSSRTTTLTRTITWQGQTYDVGAQTSAHINTLIFSPGYQYDFFRLKQGFLGFLVYVNLAYTEAELKATGTLSGGGGSANGTVSSKGSVFAPLPAIGPTFRWYPIPDSSRLYLDGTLSGMSFFGYGSFVSANAILGFPIGRHWDAHAGYLMGSRLKITEADSDIAIRLTQKGPVFGVEYHWGTR